MDVMYWTFEGVDGIWSVRAGSPNILTAHGTHGPHEVRCDVFDWVHGAPVIKTGSGVHAKQLFGKPFTFPRRAPSSGAAPTAEKSGGSVNYYKLQVNPPKASCRLPYNTECNDIIEALGMTFAEGNVFKALWRSCAERTLGKQKKGGDAVYDAEKMVFFSERVLDQRKGNNAA